MAQLVSDSLNTMRLAIGRRNKNDPDSSDTTLLKYINNFMTLTMSNDVRLFEQYGTLEFEITSGTDTYTFNDVGADDDFVNISLEAFITLTDPPAESISWNRLKVYQDPGEFYAYWGVNNEDVLIEGYPTEMLFYGTEMVFRTIPDDTYTVYIYGYKYLSSLTQTSNLPFDYWMRYIAYGAALDYAMDYRFEPESVAPIKSAFTRERKLLLTRTHNQRKLSRAKPRF